MEAQTAEAKGKAPGAELHPLLAEVIETLAPIERGACSEGEREAADWIAAKLGELGCEARIEEEQAWTNWARPIGAMMAIAGLAGVASLRGRRRLGALGGLAMLAGISEDIENGPRLFRRATMRQHTTSNVVAETGDLTASKTLVFFAHHDAAPTGRNFETNQDLHGWLGENFPDFIERTDTGLPLWWPVVGGPGLVAAGSLLGRRGLTFAGAALCALGVVSIGDIARHRIVPGANDNLSGVAALAGLAAVLRERPIEGVRVILLSAGAEEVLQGGIHGFVRRHAPELPPDRTWYLNVDPVGAPILMLLEGEGELWMEDYTDPGFRDLVAEAAEEAGVYLRRNMRSRASTDSVIPSRAGYPTATLVSADEIKRIPNYHLMSDVPEHIQYDTVAGSVAVAEKLLHRIAAQ